MTISQLREALDQVEAAAGSDIRVVITGDMCYRDPLTRVPDVDLELNSDETLTFAQDVRKDSAGNLVLVL